MLVKTYALISVSIARTELIFMYPIEKYMTGSDIAIIKDSIADKTLVVRITVAVPYRMLQDHFGRLLTRCPVFARTDCPDGEKTKSTNCLACGEDLGPIIRERDMK